LQTIAPATLSLLFDGDDGACVFTPMRGSLVKWWGGYDEAMAPLAALSELLTERLPLTVWR
jgi:hypothetical protein